MSYWRHSHKPLTRENFSETGLVKPSLVRLNFLAIVRPAEILGQMGCLSVDRHQRLLSNLATYLKV
jgi:hypothetical protein